MDYSSFNDSELQKFIVYHSRLAPGDKLAGKVIEVKSDHRVLIDFGRFRALAESPFSLFPGDWIHVVVESRRPRLKLRLEASSESFPAPVSGQALSLPQVLSQPWRDVSMILQPVLHCEDVARTLFICFFEVMQFLQQPEATVKLKTFPVDSQGFGQVSRLSLLVERGTSFRMRVDFLPLPAEKKLNITYYVKTQEEKEVLEGYLPVLRQQLQVHFLYLVLNVFQSELSIARFESEEIQKQTGSVSVLDVNG